MCIYNSITYFIKLKIAAKSLFMRIDTPQIQQIILIGVVCGSFLEISGGIWDSISHILHEPEYFWTIQHIVVYSGIIIISISAILGILFLIKYKTKVKFGLLFIVFGTMLQLSAGYIDSISHDIFGLDGLISIPHQTLESGLSLTSFGALLTSYQTRHRELDFLFILSIILFVFSMGWLIFNLSLLVIDTIVCVLIYQIFSSGCAIL